MNIAILFAIPLISSLIILCMPVRILKQVALGLSALPFIWLAAAHVHWIGADFDYPWMPAVGIQFYLKVDGVSLLFLFLTALVVPIALLGAVPSQHLSYPRLFFFLILLLQGILIGFFTARDLALFTLLWEAMLIPVYLIIALWGGRGAGLAAFKFLLYNIAGSVLMVAAVVALYFAVGSFNLDLLARQSATAPYALWIFLVFLLAFAVKTPLFPLHAWLPDAYTQAPTVGTILLAGLLSKAGIYGIVRIGFELFPTYIQAWSPLILGLAIAGVLYGGLLAWVQQDFKRLIAYSSFAHVNFILIGLFIWDLTAHAGALLQAFNHGITITALFLTAGWLEQKIGSTAMAPYSGLACYLPKLCWLTLFFVLASIALPGLNNFVGEVMILFGLFGVHPWLTALLGTTVILSAMYMLRWMQKVYFEAPVAQESSWIDIQGKELAIASPLIALVLWLGIYPQPILEQIWMALEKLK
jgi:NADH-quinone oxidoreductase subunit M